ncbi:MAG: hypothetical protein K2M60_01105 [Lachnospiraceae bacterium]|nr:hypothetical protein [Lachnospiraceae bacterium]MDE6251410.1 hypothetical protein [Lachnospiraceae bacterium]
MSRCEHKVNIDRTVKESSNYDYEIHNNKQTTALLVKSVIAIIIGFSFIVLSNIIFNVDKKNESATETIQTFDYNEDLIEEEIIQKELDDILEKYDEWSTREIDFK